MTIQTLSNTEFFALEGDLCSLHKCERDEVRITAEWSLITNSFSDSFPLMRDRENYEIPDWHHNIRMFWVYLYSSEFYTPGFTDRIRAILGALPTQWFAQFECYSEVTPPGEAVGDRYLGHFIIYKDSLLISETFAARGFLKFLTNMSSEMS